MCFRTNSFGGIPVARGMVSLAYRRADSRTTDGNAVVANPIDYS